MPLQPTPPVNIPPEDPDAMLPPPPDPAEGQDIVPEEPPDQKPTGRREGVVSDPDAHPRLP